MSRPSRTIQIRRPTSALSLILKRRLLDWILNGRTERRPARFAVLPGDVVSDEVIVAGIYEEVLLASVFEHLLASRLDHLKRSVALDIGANIGNHSVFFSKFFARTIAFEPNPATLAVLQCNATLSGNGRIDIVPVGLADQDGSFEFAEDISGNLGGSGFVFAGVRAPARIKCEVRRGDAVLAEKRLEGPIGLVKIDVEGAELAVLRGLTGSLREFGPLILFESNVSAGPSGGNAVLDHLRSLGYCHFVALDDGSERGRAARLLGAAVRGDAVRLSEIDRLEDRRYPLILASRENVV